MSNKYQYHSDFFLFHGIFWLVAAILDSDTCVIYTTWLDVQFGSSNQIAYFNPGIRLQNVL
jgi:hypothetical protein